MMAVVEGQGGVHPKMAGILNKAFMGVKKVGGDIGKHKRRLNNAVSNRLWHLSTTKGEQVHR